MLDFVDYQSHNTTLIVRNTIINANITSDDTIEVYGKVNGEIRTESLLSIYGNINGKTYAKDLIVRSKAFLYGDSDIFFDGLVEKDGLFVGNINCRCFEIRGSIRGNINASENVIIRSGGSIDGDIICHNLIVDKGGLINGNVKLVYRY